MKELWDQHGYDHLALSRQNLRDQAARLEKSLGNAAGNIVSNVRRRQRNEVERNDIESTVNIENFSTEQNANQAYQGTNLHINQPSTPPGPVKTQQSEEERALMEKASQMFGLVYTQPGNYENREIDTRTKERPTKNDIEIINNTVTKLVNQSSAVSPIEIG